MIARLVLIILPLFLIGVLVIDGSDYDASIYDFKPSGSREGEYLKFAPGEISGYILKSPPKFYDKDNLYEYMNGHAEYYISYGFKKGMISEYCIKDSKDADEVVLLIELFDMDNFSNGFGSLASDSETRINLGDGIAYDERSDNIRNIVIGRYKIRLESFSKSIDLSSIKDRYLSLFESEKRDRGLFDMLPDESFSSLRFVKNDFLGIGIFKDVYIKEYEEDGHAYYGFYIKVKDGSLSDEILKRYRELEVIVLPFDEGSISGYDIEDEYEPFSFISDSKSVVGVAGDYTDQLKKRFFERFLAKSKR